MTCPGRGGAQGAAGCARPTDMQNSEKGHWGRWAGGQALALGPRVSAAGAWGLTGFLKELELGWGTSGLEGPGCPEGKLGSWCRVFPSHPPRKEWVPVFLGGGGGGCHKSNLEIWAGVLWGPGRNRPRCQSDSS